MLSRFHKALHNRAQGNRRGQAYDVGEQPPASAGNDRLYADPAELMGALRQMMSNGKEHPAFILDYSHLLVTQPDHPDPAERAWMLQMGKIITGPNVVPVHSDALRHSGSVIILLTNSLGKLPPGLYQGDPRVKLIPIPTPTVQERKGFFLRHMDDLRCERPKPAGPIPIVSTAAAGHEGLADIRAVGTTTAAYLRRGRLGSRRL
jgi:hypothetical protein